LSAMSLNLLPPEMIFRIFDYLDFTDLKTAVQVCRHWRNIGEDPNLWKTIKITEIHPDDLKIVLNLPRLAKIQYVKIADWLVDEHVEMLKRKTDNLKCLDISKCFLHDIDPEVKSVNAELLSEVLNNVEVVNANRTVFSEEQLLEIFQKMSKSTRIKTLIINTTEEEDEEDIFADLSFIPPDLFGKALSNLEIVQISDACLTSDQLEALIKNMNKESNIKHLGIANNDISEIDSEELGRALNKLEKLDLSGTNFGDLEHPSLFFKQMVESTELKILDLGFNSFGNNNNRSLDPKLFARALNKIENLRMIGVDISAVQAQEFFKRMCVQTRIKELHFEDCKYDMSLVNPNFMASGLNKLTKLKMANSSINGPQCLELFLRMAQFTKLQYLDLSFLDLCGIPTDILAEALNKVEKVIISDCHITEDQSVALFKTIAISTNISYLDLSLVSLEHVPAKVLADGAVNLETLRVVDSDLLKDQLEAILLQVSEDSKLKVLELSQDDAFTISDEIVLKSKLEELRFREDYEYDEENLLQFYNP